MPDLILLVDGMYLAFSSFYAHGNMRTLKGEPTGSLYGFITRVENLIKTLQPGIVAAAFDTREKTFRHHMFPEYKAKREKPPEDLIKQLPYIKEYLDIRGIQSIETPGFEADDIIAAIAKDYGSRGHKVVIFSADKDLFQLVNDRVSIYHPRQKAVLDSSGIEEHFGVSPGRIVDYLSLVGDSSDNIPGVPGIGDKTAKKLLAKYGGVDEMLAQLDKMEEKFKNKINDNLELLKLSRTLVDLDHVPDFELKFKPETFPNRVNDDLVALYRKFSFTRLLKGIKGVSLSEEKIEIQYHVIKEPAQLDALTEKIAREKYFAFDVETTELEFFKSRLVGLSISFESEGYYIPFNTTGISFADFEQKMAALFRDENIKKTGHNLKFDILHLKAAGIEVKGTADDSMIMSYLLNANRRAHNLKDLTLDYLQYQQVEYGDLVGKGKNKLLLEDLAMEKISRYCIDDSCLSFKLSELLRKKLLEKKLTGLYKNIEIPLVTVLMEMEFAGVKVDVDFLKAAHKQMAEKLLEIEAEVFRTAGYRFNLNSSQQLGELLFEKMNLPIKKRTRKTKSYSTDIEVLKELRSFPVVEKIIDYRTYKKLSSTYLEGIINDIDENNRVHTSYNQTVTATGRLSSSNPNLQNIPVGEMGGVNVRKAFIAEPGKMLLAADYSQVELRVMAHCSGDEKLIEAFANDFDIHRHTAETVFGKDLFLTAQERRKRAKIINFSVLYGSGPYSLSKELGVSFKEARDFIDMYFEKYSGVKAFMEKVISEAEIDPVVKTIAGRIREIPEITSENRTVKENGKRMAINTVIQGSAADIIKIAMINIRERLQGMESRLIMQVHDELVFEYPPQEEEKLFEMVKKEMENGSKLKVPLKVVLKKGTNWGEMEESEL
ncbi:MAG: DNA polymerase I [Candidatus Aminicenantes bacterium]|nr:DNA polymerase I [Candidatus Aminicenantes bacterium]